MKYWEDEPPSYDARPSGRRRGSVVRTLIILNVAIFLLEFLASLGGDERFYRLFEPFGLSPEAVFHRGWLWQFITYAFLHDPNSLMHILFNMLFLYWFGSEIEEIWGAKRFIWFYLGGAVFAGLCFVLIGRADSWCIGASGAIYGLVMAYRLYWPNRVILFMLFFPMRIKTFVWIVVVIETYSVLKSNPRNGVANAAHLGGLLFGYVVVRFGPAISGWFESKVHGRLEPTEQEERRRDEILDKVSREGINALTWWERRFMRRFRRK